MSTVSDAVGLLGCGNDEWREAMRYETMEEAWAGFDSGCFVAWLLRRVGFSWERVSKPLFDALDERLRIEARKYTGGFETPEAAYNLACFVKRAVDGESPRSSAGDQAIADVFRAEFAFDEVRQCLLDTLTTRS
jgi:hypothetical protein